MNNQYRLRLARYIEDTKLKVSVEIRIRDRGPLPARLVVWVLHIQTLMAAASCLLFMSTKEPRYLVAFAGLGLLTFLVNRASAPYMKPVVHLTLLQIERELIGSAAGRKS